MVESSLESVELFVGGLFPSFEFDLDAAVCLLFDESVKNYTIS